jgi:DNA processing protein
MKSKEELFYWLALLRAPKLGAIGFKRISERFRSVADVFACSSDEYKLYQFPEELIIFLQNPPWRQIENDLAWLNSSDKTILTLQDEAYPRLLKETSGAPAVLFVQGNIANLSMPQIAIVGSRNPTTSGAACAFEFAKYLAKNGFVITSGLALGIDTASHQGALVADGRTIAVMGAGLDRIYPAKNEGLAAKIIRNDGAVISEFLPRTPPKPEFFPRRNRIISGLSLGVLVVEAALKSGSLITAKYALEQGREVFAIPGSIHNPLARGCHTLLRQGAKLVETAADILEELGALIGSVSLQISEQVIEEFQAPCDKELAKLFSYAGFEPTSIDSFVERSGLTVEKVSSMLIGLELEGYLLSVPGGYIRNLKR